MAASVVLVINKGTAVAAHLRVRDTEIGTTQLSLPTCHCATLLIKVPLAVGLWLIVSYQNNIPHLPSALACEHGAVIDPQRCELINNVIKLMKAH